MTVKLKFAVFKILQCNRRYFNQRRFYIFTDDYIKWNGMTVGIVDQLNKWYNSSEEASTNYIEADIIRLDIPDDSHIVSEIANELRKGVYIEKL